MKKNEKGNLEFPLVFHREKFKGSDEEAIKVVDNIISAINGLTIAHGGSEIFKVSIETKKIKKCPERTLIVATLETEDTIENKKVIKKVVSLIETIVKVAK